MPEQEAVLITGVSGFFGSRVAEKLLSRALPLGNAPGEEKDYRVIGIDIRPPEQEIAGLDFIPADIRNPLLVDLLKSERVHTVCHLVFTDTIHPSESAFDVNVIGSMKVLGACAEAGVRKVILMSSTKVYGAHPTNPAFIEEQAPLQGSRAYGYTRDMVEIEAFTNGFRRQVPEVLMTTLRFPSIVGPNVNSPMTRFLLEPITPVLMGFDPRMQVIHEEDVVDALIHAVVHDAPGVFNIAADGVLPLIKLMRLAGKMPVPVFHLFAYWGTGLLAGTGLKLNRLVPIELDYLRYPWVADVTRMREEFGFEPRYTAEEVMREFAGHQRLQPYQSESAALAYDEERLKDTIERRERARRRQAASIDAQQEANHE